MKKALLGMMLLAGTAGTSLFAAPHVSIGIGFGAPAPVAVVRPPCPGPGYSWVDGYYANSGWVAGYWAPPVVRVAPRYERPLVDRAYDHRYERREFDRRHDFRR